jgi:zinc transporter 2
MKKSSCGHLHSSFSSHKHDKAHDHDNMNIRAAIIHIIGDIIQSIGVVIAAIIVFANPDWYIADPITTFIFTFLCLFTTIPIFKDCVTVLMEATPKSIDINACY